MIIFLMLRGSFISFSLSNLIAFPIPTVKLQSMPSQNNIIIPKSSAALSENAHWTLTGIGQFIPGCSFQSEQKPALKILKIEWGRVEIVKKNSKCVHKFVFLDRI